MFLYMRIIYMSYISISIYITLQNKGKTALLRKT